MTNRETDLIFHTMMMNHHNLLAYRLETLLDRISLDDDVMTEETLAIFYEIEDHEEIASSHEYKCDMLQ